eukprot:2908297-Pyramimonas_sp.AAC.1
MSHSGLFPKDVKHLREGGATTKHPAQTVLPRSIVRIYMQQSWCAYLFIPCAAVCIGRESIPQQALFPNQQTQRMAALPPNAGHMSAFVTKSRMFTEIKLCDIIVP